MPVLTSPYLIHAIKALARVTLPDAFSWDSSTKFALLNVQGSVFHVIFSIAK